MSSDMYTSRKTLNQVLTLATVAFNDLMLGIAIGWLAPTLIIMQDPEGEFRATLDQSSWLACLEYIGEIPGAIFTAFVLDIVGRKILLASACFVFFFMWIVNTCTRSMTLLCAVRFLFGVFIGINDSTNSTYLAENSSPKIRSIFGFICTAIYYMGLLFEYVIGAYFSYIVACMINASIGFVALISILWIKEPVQFLLMKGNIKQAEENFIWLQGGNVDSDKIKNEFEQIKHNVRMENLKKSSFKAIVTSRANYRSLFIVVTLYALAGCTGYFPVMSYASLTFSASDILTADEFTILFGVAQLVVIIPTTFFIERFNRRRITLGCLTLIALCHITTALLYYTNSKIIQVPCFPWLIFLSITFYASIYAILYPVIFIIRGELFPLSVKATGGCLSVISWSATTFVTTKIFLHLSECFGIESNFFMYSAFSVITLVFVYHFLPETKDKTLIEIQEMLDQN